MRCDRVPDNAGGGCTILVTEDVMYNNAFAKSIGSLTEICGIKIKDVHFVCVYRKPHLDKSNDRLVVNFLKSKLENKKVFLAGDLNMRRFDWKNLVISGNSDQKSKVEARDALWTDLMIVMDWEQMISVPTDNLDGRLDVVIRNMDYNILVKEPVVQADFFRSFSDHYAITAEVNIVIEHKSKIRKVFNERAMPWDEVRRVFNERVVGDEVEGFIYADNKWVCIRDTLYELHSELCSLKKVGFSSKSPWINKYLRTLLRTERKLRRSACNRNLPNQKRMSKKEIWIRQQK